MARAAAGGFTLIELICVLILVGVLGAGLTVGFTYVSKRHQALRNDYQQAQKMQVAVARIYYEIKNSGGVTLSGNTASFTFGSAKSLYASSGRLILSVAGAEHVLCDNIASLSMTYASNLLRITFVTNLAEGNSAATVLYIHR